MAGGHAHSQRQTHTGKGVFGAVQGKFRQVVCVRTQRVVGGGLYVVRRRCRAAYPFACHPVNARWLLHAVRRDRGAVHRLRQGYLVLQQQPGLQPPA